MDFKHIYSFDNYIDANIVMGRLESEQINCWLKDENTVTVNPMWNQAIGGIKLMVASSQVDRAVQLLREFRTELKQKTTCPKCGSLNVEFVSSPKKATYWLSAILALLSAPASPAAKVYHCFNCGNEFEEVE